MSAAEREQALAGRSAEARKILESKLKEYEALPPEEREIRVRAVQFRVYLRPLMEVPASNRVDQLARIPEPDRTLIAERLQHWDQLSPDLRSELLQNESALSALIHPELALPRGRPNAEATVKHQAAMEVAIQRWHALPEEKRRQLQQHFHLVFRLDDEQKEKSFQTLNETERRQMDRTVQTFRALTPAQRDACIASVQRFTELSSHERAEFLRNVELWQDMTPKERQLWREMVARFRVRRPPPPPPPLPPRALPSVPVRGLDSMVATNN
jgi:hypothetical protein